MWLPVIITTPVSLLSNEFDVGSVLHWQVSLAAVNQICVIHEAMHYCKKSTDSLKACFENVSILERDNAVINYCVDMVNISSVNIWIIFLWEICLENIINKITSGNVSIVSVGSQCVYNIKV